MVVASFAEVLSIGAVLPFLGVLMTPEQLFGNPSVQPFAKILNINQADELLLPLTVIFVTAALFSGVMRLVLLWWQTQIGFAIGADFSFQIYMKTLYQPYAIHVSRNSSQIIATISTKTTLVINYFLLPILFIISSLLILIAIMVTLVIIKPFAALIVFSGFGLLYGIISQYTKQKLVKYSSCVSVKSNEAIKILQEGLGGIRDVLIDGTQRVYCNIYKNTDRLLRRSQANIQIIAGAPRFLMESLGMAIIAILAYVLATGKSGIDGAIPILGLLALSAQRLLPVVQSIYSSWTSMNGSLSSVQDVLELLEQELPDNIDRSTINPIGFNKYLRINNLGFCYPEADSWILRDISIEIQKGSCIGLIGKSGAGKSTLIDIMLGLLHPTKGTIDVDGVIISSDNCSSWQMCVAHVPQVIFLSDSTVAENIALGVPQNLIDYGRIKKVAQAAQIEETIESWSENYHTLVGERGVRLSGGQRQRIGIARALYKKPEILILDEATSALDNETEKSIMETVYNLPGNVTTIIVAHRLSTLSKCDEIYQVENGKIFKTNLIT